MAKRKHLRYRTLDSSEVHGEGSFVKIRNLSMAELAEYTQGQDKAKLSEKEAATMGMQVLDRMIVDWNWVDDDDNPLPIPAENPGTVASLPFQESTWLMNASGLSEMYGQKN